MTDDQKQWHDGVREQERAYKAAERNRVGEWARTWRPSRWLIIPGLVLLIGGLIIAWAIAAIFFGFTFSFLFRR